MYYFIANEKGELVKMIDKLHGFGLKVTEFENILIICHLYSGKEYYLSSVFKLKK